MIFSDEGSESVADVLAASSLGKDDFVQNALKGLSLNEQINAKELPRPVFNAIEKLIIERDHWRRESNTFSQETFRIHKVNEELRRGKEQSDLLVENLKRDVQAANARTSKYLDEQRVLKNQWLAEKSDLQSRLCQIQALNTQIQGTVVKKEKEFVNLQAQLAKTTKDSMKSLKSVMTVSMPMPRAGSQQKTNPSVAALLKDAELQSLRNSQLSLQKENSDLRNSLGDIENQLHLLQGTFNESLKAVEEKYKLQIDALSQKTPEDQGDKTQSVTWNEANEIRDVVETMPDTPHLQINAEPIKSALKTPGALAQKYLEGTPGARPVKWLVNQTNTEVKILRSQAESIISGSSISDNRVIETLEINTLRAQLAEAMVIIQEQDRLIHEGK